MCKEVKYVNKTEYVLFYYLENVSKLYSIIYCQEKLLDRACVIVYRIKSLRF